MIGYKRCNTVAEAEEVLRACVEGQGGGDDKYFCGQRERFIYTAERILALFPPPRRVLDIGSHYLHQATLLSLLGYDVVGLDVPTFTEVPFIAERARVMNIANTATQAHQSGEFLNGMDRQFDLVVCTEFLEHITFNPVCFWRRVWELLKDNGRIYLTTPNAFRVKALLKSIKRLLRCEGIGIAVSDVLDVVTYGHHWKEYSRAEIKMYFRRLSPDFDVTVGTYPDSASNRRGWRQILECIPGMRSNLEAIIQMRGRSRFADPPVLPITVSQQREDRVNVTIAQERVSSL